MEKKQEKKEFGELSYKKIILILALAIVVPLVYPLILVLGICFTENPILYKLMNICIAIKSTVPIIALLALIVGPIMLVLSWFGIIKGEKADVIKYIGIGLLLCGVLGLIIAAYADRIPWIFGTPAIGGTATQLEPTLTC